MVAMAKSFAYLTFLLFLLPGLYLCFTDQCDLDLLRIPGDIVLSTIVPLREPRNGVCGDFTPGAIQEAAGMVWAVEKLNGSNLGESYIRGKTIGIDIADDCGLDRKAVRIALDTLTRVGSPDISTCSHLQNYNDTSSTVVGIIDTSTSQTVQKVADILKDSVLPVIASAATAPALANATVYPNFFRTVSSDIEQTKVLLQIVKQLKWSYIAVVYTTDAYGKEGAQLFRELVQQDEKLCIMTELAMPPDEIKYDIAKDIFSSLASKLSKTKHNYLGIVYIGQFAQAALLVQAQQEVTKLVKDYERLFWVMSEAVGTTEEIIPDTNNQLGGVITVALPSVKIAEFRTYFINQLEIVVQGKSTHPLKGLFKKYIENIHKCKFSLESGCSKISRESLEKKYRLSGYVGTAIDAVYVLVTALKNSGSSCAENPECIPPSHKLRNLVTQVRETTLDYSLIDDRFAPYEYSLLKRKIKFDKSGDVISNDEAVSYEIYNVWAKKRIPVGRYKNHTLRLTTDKINARDPESGLPVTGSKLPRATCQASCPECIKVKDIPFSYIPGDLLIAGLFSLSSKIDGNFHCGDFRNHTVSYLTFEAFQHAIKVVQKQYPGPRFGGIAFDDCYSPLRAEYILSNFLSGIYKLVDYRTNAVIDPEKVVLVVGPLSSDVSLEVADILTRLRIPQISYGATSPDLSNKEKYPYFLRTIPSDEIQAKAIVNILVKMKWDYVAVMYFDNNYGTKGMETFKRYANEKGICLAEAVIPITKDIITQSLKSIVSRLRRSYVKVIVYFGIDTLAETLLDGLKKHADDGEFLFVASEAWGVSKLLLQDGRENYAKGSIVLHSDTESQGQTQDFDEYLGRKNPFTCTRCDWFRLFWQDRFKCNFEDGFNGPDVDFDLCDSKQRISDSDINKYSYNQRVVQTINAVFAGVSGIKRMLQNICSGAVCMPSFLFRRDVEDAKSLVGNISKVVLPPSVKPFDENGNGKTGFSILNIQYSHVTGRYEYVKVGTYEENALLLEKEKLIFYDKYGREQKYGFVNAKCELDACTGCEKQISPHLDLVDTTAESYTTTEDSLNGALIGVSVIACVAFVAFIVATIVCCICLRKIPASRPASENHYQEVGDRINPAFSISESSEFTNAHLPIQNMPVYQEVNMVQDVGACSGDTRPAGESGGSSGNARPSFYLSQISATSEFMGHCCTCIKPLFEPVRYGSGTIPVCTTCRGVFSDTTLSGTTGLSV